MKYFFLALSMVVLLVACDKAPIVTPSTENLLRDKKWQLESGKLTVKKPNGKDTILNYFDLIPTCYKDDYLRFDSLHFGRLYLGGDRCSPADPEARSFTWRLWNNDKYIDLYDGFNDIFAVSTTIAPYRFETVSHSPLVLDTLVGMTDTTPGFTKLYIILDTIREVKFNSYPLQDFDIFGAEIENFTESSFKLKFSFKTKRLDSTNIHAGMPGNNNPIELPDTARYQLIFKGFN